MKPSLLKAVITDNIGAIPKNNLVSYNEPNNIILFKDAELNYDDLKILIDNNDGILGHIVDKTLHWSPAERREYADYKALVNSHTNNTTIHITEMDRSNWDSKETEEGAQLKANAVEELLEIHKNDADVHITKLEKDRWNNSYTREQIAALLNAAKTDTIWKKAVATYEDLYTTYPNAKKGWLCTVLGTEDNPLNMTYIFAENVLIDGSEPPQYTDKWIVAFSNAVPLASENYSGKMSKEDFIKLQNIEPNANYYIHPDNINMRHVTDAEKKIWSNKAPKDLATIFSPGLISPSDKEKIDTVEKYANYYVHPDTHEPEIIAQNATHRFVTDAQISLWNDKPTGKLASEENDGQMSKEDYIKLFEIEPKANNYVHPLKHSSTDIAQDTNHRFVTDAQISIWDNKEDKIQSQYRADKALEFSKEYTDTKITQLVGLAPDVLNTFEELGAALNNDPNFASNVTISLSNKADKSTYLQHAADFSTHLSNSDRLKFNSIQENANYYTHPDHHPASMIQTDSNNRFISDIERVEWNNKANGNLATESLAGQMSPQMVQKLNAITTTGEIMSDWNETNEDSGSFIRNKPSKLPADGGDSSTVESYSASQLVNSRKGATLVIGCTSSGFTTKDVDFLCTGTGDSSIISNAFDSINEIGGSILFREGVYLIDTPLIFSKSNVILKSSGGVTLKCGFTEDVPILYMTGDNNTIENIMFDSDVNVDGVCLRLTGDTNTVKGCKFKIGHGVMISSGSFNKIINNSFNVGKTGVYVNILDEACFGNIINDNTIIDYKLGVNIESDTNKTNGNNIINGNTIYNCLSGIKLTNLLQAHNSINNVITNNNIMRGTGLSSDYLYEQHTIRIEKGAFNLVTNNVLRGREAVNEGVNNVIANNISV